MSYKAAYFKLFNGLTNIYKNIEDLQKLGEELVIKDDTEPIELIRTDNTDDNL